jgi:hypothetical protein
MEWHCLATSFTPQGNYCSLVREEIDAIGEYYRTTEVESILELQVHNISQNICINKQTGNNKK